MSISLFTALAAAGEARELSQVLACNERSEEFGLFLTPEEAKQLVAAKNESLAKCQRAEFGSGVLNKLIEAFCDSDFIEQDEYLNILSELQDIFYLFKNESVDELSDDELIAFMREQFETVCFGDLDYLADTCLERFSRAVRAGYRGFRSSGGHGEYENLAQEKRWDKDLYMEVLRELFW